MKFGIIGNITKPTLKEVTDTLLAYLREKDLDFVVEASLSEWYNQSVDSHQKISSDKICAENDLATGCDVLIALGGDGTMLTAARIVGSTGIPILGVNLGKLGFLAEVSVHEMYSALATICSKTFTVEERLTLQAGTSPTKNQLFALNEIVVDKGSSPRVIQLETYVNDEFLVTYAADGIIIATPTGSTAYSLASGGPIVTPSSDVIVINPVSPHSLTARPVVVPANSSVRIVVHTAHKQVHATADGHSEQFMEPPAEIFIKKAPYTIKLIKMRKYSHFDLLRAKLMWGRDARVGLKP